MQHSNIWNVFDCFWIVQLIQWLQIESRNRWGTSGYDHLNGLACWRGFVCYLCWTREQHRKGHWNRLLFSLCCCQAHQFKCKLSSAFCTCIQQTSAPFIFIHMWFSDFPAWPEQAHCLHSPAFGKTSELLAHNSESYLQKNLAQISHSQPPNTQLTTDQAGA